MRPAAIPVGADEDEGNLGGVRNIAAEVVEAFARGAKARGDELRTDFKPDDVDFEEIKSYCDAFPDDLRKSATIIPVLNVARSASRTCQSRAAHT